MKSIIEKWFQYWPTQSCNRESQLICGFYGDPMLQLLYVPTVLSQSAEVNEQKITKIEKTKADQAVSAWLVEVMLGVCDHRL